MSLITTMTEHLPASAVAAAGTSFLATLGVASQTIPIPAGTPPGLALALSVLGPVLVFVARHLLAVYSAKKKAHAALLEKRAAALRADTDPSNDGQADKLEDEAAEDRAAAEALDNLQKR